LQGEQAMAKPHDTQDHHALQDHHMVMELMVALQVIDEKMELEGSLYEMKIKPLILIQCLNTSDYASATLSK
jgi:hypothetical protein